MRPTKAKLLGYQDVRDFIPSPRSHEDQETRDDSRARADDPASPDLPAIRFSTTSCFCEVADGEAVVHVWRIGDCSRESQIPFETAEGSAKAGSGFIHASGVLVFEPGVREKSIRIKVIPSTHWTPTLEFRCHLITDQRMQNAHVPLHARRVRVKIADLRCFPSDRFESDIKAGNGDNVPMVSLFYEYLKLNWANPVVRSRTWACIFIDQLHNVFMFGQFFVQVYLVDYVLNDDCDHFIFVNSRHHALFLIFVLKVLPFAVLHAADYLKVSRFGVAPASLDMLKSGLLRKMLNADRDHRQDLRSGDLIMTATRDSEKVVFQGYVTVLLVLQSLGQLFFTFLYQIVAPIAFDKPFNPYSCLPLVAFPLLLGIFLCCRMGTTTRELDEKAMMNNEVVSHIDESATNYALFTAYSHRDECIEDFENLMAKHHGHMRTCNLVLSGNHYFTMWTMTIVVAGFTLLGGYRVITGGVTLGMFLTNIHIFTIIGQSWAGIYNHALIIIETFPALQRIVEFMNVPSDVDERAALSRCQCDATMELSRTLATEGDTSFCPDRMPIRAQNLHLVNAARGADPCPPGLLEIKQGEFVVVMGPGGEGKGTVLRILGGEILPDPTKISTEATTDRGQLFVPSHLRNLHVTTPLFMRGDLLDNLTFGCQQGGADADMKRVLTLCDRIGVAPAVKHHIDKRNKHNWAHVLTETECQKISLIRALVANPEILVIHHPTQGFDSETAERILGILREFVDKRGLENPQQFRYRRPRTCVITGTNDMAIKFADRVFDVSREHGIQLQKPPADT